MVTLLLSGLPFELDHRASRFCKSVDCIFQRLGCGKSDLACKTDRYNDCYSKNKSWLDKAYNFYGRCDVENVAIGGLGAKDATALKSITKTDRTPIIPNPKRITNSFPE